MFAYFPVCSLETVTTQIYLYTLFCMGIKFVVARNVGKRNARVTLVGKPAGKS